ncbi:pilus assembly PilX family protein [Desulfonema magnum]|nr:PilX N-terminal domain-containing pilus assembly protein [Desulfonema magnum]
MKKLDFLTNEDGFVLVVAMIMLVFLSLLGVAATNTSSLEIQIAANERTYKKNFYKAEAALREAMQKINSNDWTVSGVDFVVSPKDLGVEEFLIDGTLIDIKKDQVMKAWLLNEANHEKASISNFAGYAAIGPIGSSGMGIGAGNLIQGVQSITFLVFGFYHKDSEPDRGEVIVDAGLRIIRSAG